MVYLERNSSLIFYTKTLETINIPIINSTAMSGPEWVLAHLENLWSTHKSNLKSVDNLRFKIYFYLK